MEAIIADIDAQFAAARRRAPRVRRAQPIVFLQNAFYDGAAIAYQDGLSTEFLTDLGFTIPAELDDFEPEGGQAYIPLEQLGVLDDADVLLWAHRVARRPDARSRPSRCTRARGGRRTVAWCSPTASPPGRSTSPAR